MTFDLLPVEAALALPKSSCTSSQKVETFSPLNHSFSLSQVVIFVGECETHATNDPNVRMFQCPEEVKANGISASLLHVVQGWHDYCDAELSDKAIMNEVKSADLVIGDGLYVCSSLIADKFSLPHVTVLMFSMTSATAALPYNFAEIPSYIPQLMSEVTDNMKFLQRAKNSVVWLVNRVIFPLLFTNSYAALKEKYSITPEKTLEQTFQRVDLVLVQTEAFEYPRPLLPSKANYLFILKSQKDLKQFLV